LSPLKDVQHDPHRFDSGRAQPARADTPDARRRALVFGTPLAAAGLAWSPPGFAASRQDFNAFGSWAAAPVSAAPADANRINNQTIRQIVFISAGGNSVRVKLSNRYGPAPLVVGGRPLRCATVTSRSSPTRVGPCGSAAKLLHHSGIRRALQRLASVQRAEP
jgi:hypothetical protein